MVFVGDLAEAMERIAPSQLAAAWDNVGLLVGDRHAGCSRVMTCLTITDCVVAEAVEKEVELIVVHHPLPFQPLKRITTNSVYGRYLWKLIRNGTSIYSAHTAFDSAEQGINQQTAVRLGLSGVLPLESVPGFANLGAGRYGELSEPVSAKELAKLVGAAVDASSVKLVGKGNTTVHRVAIGCGSGGSFLQLALKAGCDALVTGEANFHGCLEAEAEGIVLVLIGHYASERFAMEWLATHLQREFPGCTIWASQTESDPLAVIGL